MRSNLLNCKLEIDDLGIYLIIITRSLYRLTYYNLLLIYMQLKDFLSSIFFLHHLTPGQAPTLSQIIFRRVYLL